VGGWVGKYPFSNQKITRHSDLTFACHEPNLAMCARGMHRTNIIYNNMSNVVIYNLEEYTQIGATKWMTKLAKDYGLKMVRPNKQTNRPNRARQLLSLLVWIQSTSVGDRAREHPHPWLGGSFVS
jgi:hypothetical protein